MPSPQFFCFSKYQQLKQIKLYTTNTHSNKQTNKQKQHVMIQQSSSLKALALPALPLARSFHPPAAMRQRSAPGKLRSEFSKDQRGQVLWRFQESHEIHIIYASNLQQSWGAEVSKRERDYRKEWCVVDFCTRHACASEERHFSECTNSTNQAGISTSHYFSLEIYSSQHFSLGISTSEYFSLETSSEEETNPKLTLFS